MLRLSPKGGGAHNTSQGLANPLLLSLALLSSEE